MACSHFMNQALSFNCFLAYRPIKDGLGGQGSFPQPLRFWEAELAYLAWGIHSHLYKKKILSTPLNTSGRRAYFIWAESKNWRPKVPLWPHLLLSNKINYVSPCLSHGKRNTNIYRLSTVSWETANRFASPLRSTLFLSIIDPLHLYAILRLKIKSF